MSPRAAAIADLYAARLQSRALRWSIGLLAAVMAYSWIWGFVASREIDVADTFSERRLENLQRFFREIRPYPLAGKDWDWGVAFDWAAGLMKNGGWAAAGITLAISMVAVCLAGIGGNLLALPASRTVARPDPFVQDPRRASRVARAAWTALVLSTRGVMVFLRAIPEYVWAFLFITMLGVTAWPAVIALAIHNAGILGRLQSEVVENVPPQPLAALRAGGASRKQIALFGLIPITLGRFLLFFFYRWETCVREATVLGLLGMASLGAAIKEARAGQRLDDVVFFVLVGALLVLVGDALSMLARRIVRDA